MIKTDNTNTFIFTELLPMSSLLKRTGINKALALFINIVLLITDCDGINDYDNNDYNNNIDLTMSLIMRIQ